ncbi:MAG: 3-methyl-2-oxobutanoate hydroxymethyltransferase, partial [Nitrospiria bacterium]
MGRVTVPIIQEKKEKREKISVLTAYDFPFTRLMDEAGIDIILVGDSLGIVVQGEESTLPVTM